MSLRRDDPVATIYYPESDGKPMAETDTHRDLMSELIAQLKTCFQNEPDVYVSGNLMLYYEEGNPRRSVSPDVFVVRGVSKELRRIYKLWEERHAPDVVIELSSRAIWEEDLHKKWQLYQRFGVREYYVFDPEYDYLPQPLLAYRLVENEFEPVEVSERRVRSEALGLELVDTGATLRLYNPRTGQFLLTQAETEEALRAEANARQRAEDEAARLREQLEQLRRQVSSEDFRE